MSTKDVAKGDAPASPTTPSKKKGLFGGSMKLDKVLDQVRARHKEDELPAAQAPTPRRSLACASGWSVPHRVTRSDARIVVWQDLPKDDPFKPGSNKPQVDPVRKPGQKPKPYKEVIIGKRGIGAMHPFPSECAPRGFVIGGYGSESAWTWRCAEPEVDVRVWLALGVRGMGVAGEEVTIFEFACYTLPCSTWCKVCLGSPRRRRRHSGPGGGGGGRWRGPCSRGGAEKGPRQARKAGGVKGSGTMRHNARLPPVWGIRVFGPFFALPARLLGFRGGIGQK